MGSDSDFTLSHPARSQLAGVHSDFTLSHSTASTRELTAGGAHGLIFVHRAPSKSSRSLNFRKSCIVRNFENLRPVVGLIFVHRPWTAKMAGLIFVRQHLYSPKHVRANRSDFTLRESSGTCVLFSVIPLGGGSSHKPKQTLTHSPNATGS